MGSSAENDFWDWFTEASPSLTDKDPEPPVLADLDRHIRETWPELGWEIGPGADGGHYLALSPGMRHDRLAMAQSAVKSAPAIPHWIIVPYRQKKNWAGVFTFETCAGAQREIDTASWCYVLLQYPDGHREVLLRGSLLEDLSEQDRWVAGAIVLEGHLGEERAMSEIDSFELLAELPPQFASKERALSALEDAVSAAPQDMPGL